MFQKIIKSNGRTKINESAAKGKKNPKHSKPVKPHLESEMNLDSSFEDI